MDLQKNKISNASSEVNLISKASSEVNLISTPLSEVNLNSKYSKDKILNFILDNRDVGQIIIDYFEVDNKIKNAENLLLNSEKINYFENLKSEIVKDYHNCEVLLPLKKILDKIIFRELGKKKKFKKVKKIFWLFKKTNYINRKIEFYKIAKTEIESKLLVANNWKVTNYVLIDDLRYSLFLIDKIIKIYEKKNYYLWYADTFIEEMLYETSSVVSYESNDHSYDYDSWGGEQYDWNDWYD